MNLAINLQKLIILFIVSNLFRFILLLKQNTIKKGQVYKNVINAKI